MAQRTGAERFLAPLVKVASTRLVLVLAAATLLALAGCGGSSDSQTATSAEEEQTGAAKNDHGQSGTGEGISLISPSLPKTKSVPALSATYTCDGKDSWPAFSWSGVPAGTRELALLVLNAQPVHEKIFFDWAVAGLDPDLKGIDAAELPAGAVVGKNGFGENDYSICPAKGKAETFMVALYALPKPLSPKQGFDPLPLREDAEGQSGNAGLMAVSYTR